MIVLKIIGAIIAFVVCFFAFIELFANFAVLFYGFYKFYQIIFYRIPKSLFEDVAKCLVRITPDGKKHITLQVLYTLAFGFLISILLLFAIALFSTFFLSGSDVTVEDDYQYWASTNGCLRHKENSVDGYTLVADSTKIYPFADNYEEVYSEKLVFDSTGELLTGDSLYYPIIMMRVGNYMLAECVLMNDKGKMVETTAMLFQNGVKKFEKTFYDPSWKYRIVTFKTDKFIYTYTGDKKTISRGYHHYLDCFERDDKNCADKELFHYDGSELTPIESFSLHEDFRIYDIWPFLLCLVPGYFIGRRRTRKTLGEFNGSVSESPDAVAMEQNQGNRSGSGTPEERGAAKAGRKHSNRKKRKKQL